MLNKSYKHNYFIITKLLTVTKAKGKTNLALVTDKTKKKNMAKLMTLAKSEFAIK